MSLPACSIPKLRCALPGPALPGAYNINNGWQNTYAINNQTTPQMNSGTQPQEQLPAAPNPEPLPNTEDFQDGSEDTNTTPSSSDSEEAKTGVLSSFKLSSFLKPSKTDQPAQSEEGLNVTTNADHIEELPTSEKKSKGFISHLKLASFIKPASDIELDDTSAEGDKQTSSSSDPNAPPEMKLGPNVVAIGPDGPIEQPIYSQISVNGYDNSAQIPWCSFFNDPYLTALISQSLSGNQELRILAEDIQIASNEAYSRSGDYLPFVSLGAGAGLEKSSRFTREGAVEDQLSAAPGRGFPEPLPDFLVATNITWELDIWRRLRNARDAASLRYLGSRDGWSFVVTRLVADVSENYYELLALDNRLVTLNRTIEIQQQSLKITEAMKEAGRGTELAVQRFQAEVRKNESERLIIQQEIVETENRINFLLGRYPQPVERSTVEYIDLNINALSTGIPAQLLQNRPDIRQAERELQAAGLDVKVARARFYPSLGISAGVGYRAFNTKYLLDSPESLIYNVAGDLVAPLINRRAIKADYMSANARQLQALYDYQRTILEAFTEVIDNVSKVENYGQSIEVKRQQLESLEASVDNATKLFQNARADYMEVLLAQRDLMEAKMTLIDTKQQQLSALVNAYQALGGGRF